MPRSAASVIVSAGQPETGLWCPVCLLPSRIRIPLYITSELGSGLLGTKDICEDCGTLGGGG